jgi:hypothetical protein
MRTINLDVSEIIVGCSSGTVEFRSMPDVILKQLVHQLRYRVTSEHQQPITIRTPLTWFDHLVETLASRFKFLYKVYTIKYKEHKIDLKTIYPYLKTKLTPEIIGPKFTIIANMDDKQFFSSCLTDEPISPFEYNSKPIEPSLFTDCFKGALRCRACNKIIKV